MFGRWGWAEILVIILLVVVLFGSAKIPAMMRNLADGINIFKKEIKKDIPQKEKSVANKKPAARKSLSAAKKSTTVKRENGKNTTKNKK